MNDAGGVNAIAEKIHYMSLELQKELQAIEGKAERVSERKPEVKVFLSNIALS